MASAHTCAALGLAFTALAMLGVATNLAHAQEPPRELFSAIPHSTIIPSSLDARPGYMVGSEMVMVNADALQTGTLNATMFGTTYTISRDSVETRSASNYTWFGSGEQVMDAIFVVEGAQIFGLIYTPSKTFEILPVSSTVHEVYELNMSKFPPTNSADMRAAGGVQGAAGGVQGAAGGVQNPSDKNLISKLESSYVGWREYDTNKSNTVTIDVYVAMTSEAVRDYRGSPTALAQLAVDTANRAYKQNNLPIRLNVVDHRTVNGYTDAGSVESDLANLTDTSNSAFSKVRAEVERTNADVIVMFVKDYRLLSDDNEDKENTCGEAEELLADDKSSAFAVVESVCVPAHSFTNVIGYMQGAGYNSEQEANGEFGYGHGYYHAGAYKRTVMSQSAGNCDDPRTGTREVCARQGIWSDPHRNFFGTTTPAGTAESWNARVVFSTAPHIASLRGDVQSYDFTRPTGNITLPSIIPSTGTIQILANFSEPIHEWFPPYITITDGITTTVAVMEKSSDTAYTYHHRLDGESGKVHLLFSNARDLFGNPIVKTPVFGATFDADARNVTQAQPPAGSIFWMNEEFNTLGIWNTTGDGDDGATWQTRTPVESVPDQRIFINRVASSNNCDDSCFLTLRHTLDTTKPLVISFDRYVDAKTDRGEGLHVEYSADNGTTWNRLASYTHYNGGDTDRWEKTVVGLSIPQSSAMLRFHAESDRDDENVEVDNLQVFRPAAAQPDVTFGASLNSALTTITLIMSKSSSHEFIASDFTLSNGTVSSVNNPANSVARALQVSGIFHDTAVTVMYTGPDLNLGGAILNNGTAATAPPVPRSSPLLPDTVPARPLNLTATSSTDTVTLTWNDPDDSTITGYKVFSRDTATQSILTILVSDTGNANNIYVVHNLESGTEYQFAVMAVNGAGSSVVSQPVTIYTKSQTTQPPPANQDPNATLTLSRETVVINSILPRYSVTADCSGSNDPDGDTLTYSWSSDPYISDVSGNSSAITFKPPRGASYSSTSYTITCTVSDGTNTDAASKVLHVYSGGSGGLITDANQ